MSTFSEQAGQVGTGIANFLNPIIGRNSTTTQRTTATPNSTSKNATTFVIVALVIVALVIVVSFTGNSKKPETT